MSFPWIKQFFDNFHINDVISSLFWLFVRVCVCDCVSNKYMAHIISLNFHFFFFRIFQLYTIRYVQQYNKIKMEILINRYVPNGIFGSNIAKWHKAHLFQSKVAKRNKKNHLHHMELQINWIRRNSNKTKQREKVHHRILMNTRLHSAPLTE